MTDGLTPREALATVLSEVSPPDPEWVADIVGGAAPPANWPGWADAVSDALEALGFTVAPLQDAKDGEALRLLREACDSSEIELSEDPDDDDACRWMVRLLDGPEACYGYGATIAEAADACRAALDGAR